MNNIILFKARSEQTAQENLEAYITFAKKHSLIDDWNANEWDLSEICGSTKNLKTRVRVNFTSRRKDEDLTATFMEGAKAIYSEFIRIKRPKEAAKMLQTLKWLEQALINLNKPVCVTQVDASVMDEAARLIGEKNKDKWTPGRLLERLVLDYINPAKITTRPIQWYNPHSYVQPKRRDRLGKKNEAMAGTKLPDLNSIIALAEIANVSENNADQLVCAFVRLAMFAPSRISEILTLPVDCVREAQSDDGTIMGIAWRPVKGGQILTKFAVTDSAEEMARDAINYLLKLGEKPRKSAKWYSKNPDKLYLPEGMEYLRDQPITLDELRAIMGREKGFTATPSKMRLEKLGTTTDKSRGAGDGKLTYLFTFESCQEYVINKLPKIFPIVDSLTQLKYHKALFCMPANLLRPDADTIHYVPDIISISQIDHQLGNNPEGITVFSRNNKLDKDGKPWKLTSHQFRHLLNTLAQTKYLNQSLIAFWSGRKSVTQNDWYNHLEQDAYIEAYTKLSEQTPQIGAIGPIRDKAEVVAKENMISYREALSSEVKSIHITRYGVCRHDWALTPCPKDKDCINCGEHLFMKGEEKHLTEAKNQLQLLEKAVASAKNAVNENRPGAKRWLDNNEPKFIRWKLAVEKLTDPSIPNRTLISLPKPEASQTQVGLTAKIVEKNDEDTLKSLGMI